MTIHFDQVDEPDDQGLHVLDVAPHSPAARAGLLPYDDYILGTPVRVFLSAWRTRAQPGRPADRR